VPSRTLVVLAVAVAGLAPRAAADELRPRPNVVRVDHRPADQNPSVGPVDAPVTAELFFVPGQVDSNRAYKRLLDLQARHPRRLRVVFRVITRQAQVVVPIAALEAYAQGKFDEFMAAVLAKRGATVRRDHLPTLAEAAGMDQVRLDQALDRALDPDLLPEALRANERRRLRRGGTHVPELLFNGKPVGQPLASLDVDALDRVYADAYDGALALLEAGVPDRHILQAAERALAPIWAIAAYPAGPVDDAEQGFELPEGPPPLLERALALDGLPIEASDRATVEVVVLCNLRYASCRTQLDSVGRKLHDLYPDEVRLIYYPWFDLSVDGNEDAPRLHAAALCAEEQGSGWKWIDEALRQVLRGGGETSVDRLIDVVADLAEVDPRALDGCLADPRAAAAVRARVDAAVAAGVHHGPTVVIGGRVYTGGFTDWRAAAPLVDAELAPGLLERMVPAWEAR
jgi:2-hydroxychromene-2-carboxylate isomerase